MKYPDKITLEITAQDIKRGCASKYDGGNCPAWHAAIRKFPGHGASAGYLGVVVWPIEEDSGEHEVWYASRELSAWIRAFDEGETVSPSEFAMERKKPAISKEAV
jgi:hypothetical protein